MLVNKSGMHGHQVCKDSGGMVSHGFGSIFLLHIDLANYSWWPGQYDVRIWHPNIMSLSPQSVAQQMVSLYEANGTRIRVIAPGNELQLDNEHSGDVPYGGYWHSAEGITRIANWLFSVFTEFNRIKSSWMRGGLPAPGPGENEDDNNDYWGHMVNVVPLTDELHVHSYWPSRSGVDGADKYWFALRFARPPGFGSPADKGGVHFRYPDKPLVVTECGRGGGHVQGDWNIAWEYQSFFQNASSYPYMFRWHPFLWSSQDYTWHGYEIFNDTAIRQVLSSQSWNYDFDMEVVDVWDRHVEFDEYCRKFTGDDPTGGFNPNDAFGHFITANPQLVIGQPTSGVRGYTDDYPYFRRWYAGAILWCPKNNVNDVHLARTEAELPQS